MTVLTVSSATSCQQRFDFETEILASFRNTVFDYSTYYIPDEAAICSSSVIQVKGPKLHTITVPPLCCSQKLHHHTFSFRFPICIAFTGWQPFSKYVWRLLHSTRIVIHTHGCRRTMFARSLWTVWVHWCRRASCCSRWDGASAMSVVV